MFLSSLYTHTHTHTHTHKLTNSTPCLAYRRQSNSRKKVPSPHHGCSDADSDNTDSEMSASKLQTIKSIAAERKQTEKRGREIPQMSHTYDPEKYKTQPRVLENSEFMLSYIYLFIYLIFFSIYIINHWR